MSDDSESADQLLPGDRGWKPGVFTELRVHGVGNTALPWLLDDPAPKQVAGDELAGFYRSRIDRPLILDPLPEDPMPDNRCQDERLKPPSGPETGSDEGTGPKPKHWRDGLRWTDVEAYDWGGFNTGGGWKAMWILLIPFTLANVAGWLVAGRSSWGQKWVRLFALGTSLLFVTWLGALAIDLFALQCGWQQACYDRQVWLEPYSWEWFRQNPSLRMALALVVPLAVTWALWFLPGRHSNLKYERLSDATLEELSDVVLTEAAPTSENTKKSWLRNRNLWARESEVRYDARVHGAAILATLGGCVAWANWSAQRQPFDKVLAFVGFGLLVAAGFVVMGWSSFAGDNVNVSDRRKSQVRWLGWLAILFMVVIIAASFIDRDYATTDWSQVPVSPTSEDSSLHVFKDFVENLDKVRAEATVLSDSLRDALFIANGGVLVVSLLGLVWIAFRKASRAGAGRNRRLWGRWGPIVVLLTGLAIAGTLVAGAGLWLEEWLGDRPTEHLAALGLDQSIADLGDVQVTRQSLIATTRDERYLPVLVHMAQNSQPRETVLAQPVIALSSIYDLAALGFLTMLILIGVLAGVLEGRLWVRIRRKAFPIQQALRKLSNQKLTERTPEEQKAWRKVGVREMRKSPRLTRIHRLFWPPAIFIVTFGLFLLVDRLRFDLQVTQEVVDWVNARLAWLFTAARLLITAAIAVVATLVYRSYKPEAQESFGGMWDVISFLPRHYHPFAVPSYGVRAVPELAQRITTLCKRENGVERRCLVSAHSGGVVISLAAIAVLEESIQRRVSLVTYGSPTGALYGRAYPEYFDPNCLVEVANRLGDVDEGAPNPDKVRWYNLWRLTDWTGGYSFGPSRDRFLDYLGSETGSVHPKYPTSPAFAPLIDHIERIQYDPACRTLRESSEFDPLPVAIGHTDYLHDPKHIGAEDPRYQDARGALLQMLP